jgi:secondary thiamine-phosphate synthase enzyme
MPILKFKTDKMFTDISDDVQAMIPKNFEGLVNVYSPHTTCSVFQLENELLHLVDVRFFLDKLVPYVKQPEGEHRNVKYLHDMISLRSDVPVDEAINGHSHIRSLFFNSSESVPVNKSKLLLGKWKRLFFIELDPMRKRELIVTFINGHS